MITCGVGGCPNNVSASGAAKGLCGAHYSRLVKHGSELTPVKRVKSYGSEECTAPYCKRRPYSNGLCERHYDVERYSRISDQRKAIAKRQRERIRVQQEVSMGRPRPKHCEICKELGAGKRPSGPTEGICFDHDHVTGNPRGWLCARCNKALGIVKDSPDLLIKLAAYLELHGANSVVRGGRVWHESDGVPYVPLFADRSY